MYLDDDTLPALGTYIELFTKVLLSLILQLGSYYFFIGLFMYHNRHRTIRQNNLKTTYNV